MISLGNAAANVCAESGFQRLVSLRLHNLKQQAFLFLSGHQAGSQTNTSVSAENQLKGKKQFIRGMLPLLSNPPSRSFAPAIGTPVDEERQHHLLHTSSRGYDSVCAQSIKLLRKHFVGVNVLPMKACPSDLGDVAEKVSLLPKQPVAKAPRCQLLRYVPLMLDCPLESKQHAHNMLNRPLHLRSTEQGTCSEGETHTL